MNKRIAFYPISRPLLFVTFVLFVGNLPVFSQGPLAPPGAPAPVMKTLEQVEPRTPITNLPVTITQPGSYYLTTNLAGNPGGITIAASGVTLDLMGFELVGGTGDGVLVTGSRTNIAVRNGTIRGWSGDGVDADTARNGQLERLAVSSNGGKGIRAGIGSTVSYCKAMANGSDGIVVQSDGAISSCTATGNGGEGLAGTSIQGCIATDSGSVGIDGELVVACTSRNNGGDGIRLGFQGVASGCTVNGNTGNGIHGGYSSLMMGNNCSGNGRDPGDGAGIYVDGGGNRIEGNTVIGNDRGIFAFDVGNLIIKNSASMNPPEGEIGSSNYVVVAGNSLGEILVVTNSVSTVIITNTNPWVNFEF